MKRSFTRALLGAICTLCLCGVTRADILYDNLGAASAGSDVIGGFGPLADSFSTGGSAIDLTDVKVLLTNGGDTGSGTVDVSLLSDAGASPGSLLTSIGTISDADIDSSLKVFDLALASPFALAANTRYWIQLSTSDGSTAQWSWSLDTSGTGVAGEFFANRSGVFENTDGPYQMRVRAGAVPEPSSLVMLGLGGLTVLGLGWRRRRTAP